MQQRYKRWITAAGIVGVGLSMLVFFLSPVFRVSNQLAPLTKAIQKAKQTALALRLYSEDHNGNLPPSFDALLPDYLLDRGLAANLRLEAPGQNITKLRSNATILTSVLPGVDA